MIKSFAHKGLKEFYETGSKRGIQAEHASKLERMLDRLDASTSPQDMNLPGSPNHPEFPSTVLRPGETFKSHTEYRFTVEK